MKIRKAFRLAYGGKSLWKRFVRRDSWPTDEYLDISDNYTYNMALWQFAPNGIKTKIDPHYSLSLGDVVANNWRVFQIDINDMMTEIKE